MRIGTLAAAAVLGGAVGFTSAAARAAVAPALPDAGLYTTYTLSADATSISASVCGSVGGTEGCYGGGTLSGFHRACAVIEGTPSYSGNTVTRMIYVLDGQVSDTATARLWVYRKTDSIAAGFDSVAFTLRKRVDTALPAGRKAACYLAANDTYVFAGTSAATAAARIGKADFQVSAIGGSSPPQSMTGISADERGWVSMNFSGSFYLVGPNSGDVGSVGGGQAWLAGTRNGLAFGK